MAPHMNRQIISNHFDAKRFPEIKQFTRIIDVGVPVDVQGQGDLANALDYGNHSSASSVDSEVAAHIINEIRLGRILLVHRRMADTIQGLRILLLASVTSPVKNAFHLIYPLYVGVARTRS